MEQGLVLISGFFVFKNQPGGGFSVFWNPLLTKKRVNALKKIHKTPTPHLFSFSGSSLQPQTSSQDFHMRNASVHVMVCQCKAKRHLCKYCKRLCLVVILRGFTLSWARRESPLLGFVFLMGLRLLQISVPQHHQHWILLCELVHLLIKQSFPSQVQSGNYFMSELCFSNE